ncbi:MAG: hypothetical protein ABIS18_01765 [Actinomycetota bacterium]
MRGKARKVALAIVVTGLVATTQAATAGNYIGGGTFVVKQAGQEPEADRGVAVCSRSSAAGVGGACLAFPTDTSNAYVKVDDLLAGPNVAFQVCIDNNGDGRCITGGDKPQVPDPCADQIFFSHDDQGRFFNALGPLPTTRTGCVPPTVGHNGYIVFLCEGVHAVRGSTGVEPAHSHGAISGTINLSGPGPIQGFGNFCGGTRDLVVEKNYVLLD